MSTAPGIRSRSNPSTFATLAQLLPLAFAVAVVAAAAILHVTSRVLVVRIGYQLSVLDQRRVNLEHENAELKLELATLKSPQRLEAAARRSVQLVRPSPANILHVRN